MPDCLVALFLSEHIHSADRAQFEIVLRDPTRHHENIAASLRELLPNMTAEHVLAHRACTCDCFDD